MADPGFPVGGGRAPVRGRGPLMWALFSENVCKNERIGSHRGACARHAPPPDLPMPLSSYLIYKLEFLENIKQEDGSSCDLV